MKKINLVLGIICIVLGILLLLTGVAVFGVVILLIGALNVFIGVRKPKPAPAAEEPPKPTRTEVGAFSVAGTEYYQDGIKSILSDEERLSDKEVKEMFIDGEIGEDEPIYDYDMVEFQPALEPEPDNEHDPEAIAVLIEGQKVGYVPRARQAEVRAHTGSISAVIYGGNYRMVRIKDDYDDMAETWKASDLEIERFTEPARVSIRLYDK